MAALLAARYRLLIVPVLFQRDWAITELVVFGIASDEFSTKTDEPGFVLCIVAAVTRRAGRSASYAAVIALFGDERTLAWNLS